MNSKSRNSHTSSKRAMRTTLFVLTPLLMLLIILSAAVLLFLKPYNYFKPYANIVFRNTAPSSSLRTLNSYRDDDAPDLSATITVDEKQHDIVYPYYGDCYAALNCENAGLNDIPVFWGDSPDLLEKGAGQFNGSVYIGEKGNVVISGHNHTYFYNLKNCKTGDIITLETSYGVFTYKVSELVYFKDSDLTYIYPSEEDRLTLYTCWNNGMLGMSDTRLGVICELISKEFNQEDGK